MSRYFTLQEAESLLPEVERWLREAIGAKEDAQAEQEELQETASRVHLMGGVEVDVERLAVRKQAKDAAVRRLEAAIEKIQEEGCLVKDLDIGLVDFPALMEGAEVYLCWKLGEPRIGYWHHVHEGFTGRKPLERGPGDAPGSSKPN